MEGPTSEQNLNNDEPVEKETKEDVKSDSDEYETDEENEISENILLHNSSSENLQKRIDSLRESMTLLRNQLQEERELWKKEVEEVKKISSSIQLNGFVNEVPSCSVMCREVSSRDINRDLSNRDIGRDVSPRDVSRDLNYGIEFEPYREYTVSEYEQQQLKRYQEALAKAQAEKRARLQRQIAISEYKRKLLEVENMCNMELLRVRQSVQILQPLQMMVSEWNLPNSSGDACEEIVLKDKCLEKRVKESAYIQIEMMSAKLNNDIDDINIRLTATSSNAGEKWQMGDFNASGSEFQQNFEAAKI